MFSQRISTLTTQEYYAAYSNNKNTLYVQYCKPNEFDASLNIITEMKSNNFSLVFNFRDLSTHSTKLLSMIKMNDNEASVSMMNDDDITSFTLSNVAAIMLKIINQVENIKASKKEAHAYLTNEVIFVQSKKLLKSFTSLTAGLVSSVDSNGPKILERISTQLDLELAELNNLIDLNKSMSPRPKS